MEGMSHAASAAAVEADSGKGASKVPGSFSFAWLGALIAEHAESNDEPMLPSYASGFFTACCARSTAFDAPCTACATASSAAFIASSAF